MKLLTSGQKAKRRLSAIDNLKKRGFSGEDFLKSGIKTDLNILYQMSYLENEYYRFGVSPNNRTSDGQLHGRLHGVRNRNKFGKWSKEMRATYPDAFLSRVAKTLLLINARMPDFVMWSPGEEAKFKGLKFKYKFVDLKYGEFTAKMSHLLELSWPKGLSGHRTMKYLRIQETHRKNKS